MSNTEEDFRAFCIWQIERLGVFEKYQFMNSAGKKEFRKFLESKTRDRSKVETVMDEAIKLDSLPTIFEMGAIWNGMFPVPGSDPALNDEERQMRAEYLRDWYAKEAAEAQVRRAAYLARSSGSAPRRLTDADIESMRIRQMKNQERISSAAEELKKSS